MRHLLPLALVSCSIGGMAPSEAQTVYISEFMASNQDSLDDEDGDSPDWIELFNAGSTPVDLDGWYLTDDPALLTQWQIPGVTLPAGQFILIFASDKDRRDPAAELHTNFKLSAGGDYLALVQSDGITIEHDYGASYPAQITDVSYGVGMSGGSSILVGQGDQLRYKIPTGGGDDVDDGLNPDPWIGTGFNDASWSAGALGIGYARSEPDAYDQYILTDLESQMDGVHPGVYVRVEFEVADPSAVQGLNLRMRYDDGFVAYLNGQPEPVAAANAPASPTISWQSSATATRADSSAIGFEDFQIGDPPLVPGTNVLSIHGLNASSGSSDLLISPQLVASTDAALNGEVNYFTTPTPDATNSDASASPGPLVKGVPKTVAPPSAGATPVSIPITAEVSATLHPLASVVLKQRVMYDNEIEVPMVDDGSGDDAAAGDGVFTGTISTGDLAAGEMLRWRVVATDTQGNPTRVPPFPDPIDSPEYCGTVALDPSTASSLLPVLHWFASNPGGANSRSGTRSSVYFLGEFYDNILTDLHGQSTSGFPKKSYDFDFNAGDRFRWRDGEKRVKDLNLLTNWADKSKARNTLAYEVLRDAGAPYHFAFAVRVQQNGSFFSTADMVEDGDDRLLERNGLDPDGAFYKVYNSLDSTSGASKKTRKGEGSGDLQALIDGLGQSGDAKVRFGYDNVNIPAAVNYHAAIAIYCNRDHGHKNYYVYRDTDGSGEWFPIAWDVDLSFGRNWGPNYFVDNLTGATNSLTPGSQNRLYNLIYNTPEFQQMYYRRIKTVADKILQAPGTVNGKLEQRVNELLAQIDPPGVTSDADLDYAKWGSWGNGNNATAASQRLIDEFLDESGGTDRRDYLYTTLAGTIPPSQPAMAPVSISMGEFNPASGDQDEEYFTLSHSNAYATDISGWRIDGAVRMDIPAGTVIPAGMTLYVGRDALAFRGRATSPKGDEKRFLISGYGGQLSARGETIELYDELGNPIDSLSYTGSPTELQKWLRVTELMFNPAGPSVAELAADPGPDCLRLRIRRVAQHRAIQPRHQWRAVRRWHRLHPPRCDCACGGRVDRRRQQSGCVRPPLRGRPEGCWRLHGPARQRGRGAAADRCRRRECPRIYLRGRLVSGPRTGAATRSSCAMPARRSATGNSRATGRSAQNPEARRLRAIPSFRPCSRSGRKGRSPRPSWWIRRLAAMGQIGIMTD